MATETTEEAEFRRAFRDEDRRARLAGRRFAEACHAGDVEGMLIATYQLSLEVLAWPHAFRALRYRAPPDVAAAFLGVWVENKSIAMDFTRRTDVLRGLRLLFPAYNGPGRTLYRGEVIRRHRNRSWGVSWTSDLETAEKFATDHFRRYAPGGAVIVEAVAPAHAILAELDQHYEEREFIVDPRQLDRTRVVKRFEQVPKPAWATRPIPFNLT